MVPLLNTDKYSYDFGTYCVTVTLITIKLNNLHSQFTYQCADITCREVSRQYYGSKQRAKYAAF